MKIWILRHGQAEGMAASDDVRQLTPHGHEEAALMADYLADVPLDGILASPYRRAQQTAEAVQERVRLGRGIGTVAWLTPDDEPGQVLDFLGERRERNLLLVSHQPLVSQLISLMVEGHRGGHYPMPTAGLACVELDFPAAGIGQLLLLSSPLQRSG